MGEEQGLGGWWVGGVLVMHGLPQGMTHDSAGCLLLCLLALCLPLPLHKTFTPPPPLPSLLHRELTKTLKEAFLPVRHRSGLQGGRKASFPSSIYIPPSLPGRRNLEAFCMPVCIICHLRHLCLLCPRYYGEGEERERRGLRGRRPLHHQAFPLQQNKASERKGGGGC